MSHTPPPGVPILPQAGSPTPTVVPAPSVFTKLTARERDIALRLASGATNREIAGVLNISIKTVDTHRGHVLKKLECKNNVALCRLLIREGLVQP